MLGRMQPWPLTLDKLIDHAAREHGRREIVARAEDGVVVRSDYAGLRDEARRVTAALRALGIGLGDRVATIAWNDLPHLAVWYGAMGMGAVLHTLNPRLHPDQLAWIANHAGDRVLMVETMFAPLVAAVLPRLRTVEAVVLLSDLPPSVTLGGVRVLGWSEFLAQGDDAGPWGGFNEENAAGLCYTSGTTGDPKGVLYSHRSNLLHAMAMNQPDVFSLRARDVIMPVVPMFHANAWGVAFIAPMSGAKLVLPGAKLDGASLFELLEGERVTVSAAVPTVWQGLLAYLDETGERLTTLKRCLIGGSAVPEAIVRAFEDRHGVEVVHAWGMTELSPTGTVVMDRPELDGLPEGDRRRMRLKQGVTPFTVELQIAGEDGAALPRDGRSAGRLLARGPGVVQCYFGSERAAVDVDGFFDTGDVATINEHGFMQITDRAKDLIKSGGEWISSVELENGALDHPGVARAAVIARPCPRWGERPLLVVELKDRVSPPSAAEMRALLEGRVARWQLPEEMVVVPDVPIGPTGKVNKLALRARLADGNLGEIISLL